MKKLDIPTERGTVLTGVLFDDTKNADTVVIAITGIHGNFYSIPIYYNIGETLNRDGGIDFIYVQTNDAFSEIETYNVKTGEKEICGSWNKRFSYTDDDISAYMKYAAENYKHVILAGHSLGANKVIHYLSSHHDKNSPEHFMLLSPANLTYMTKEVTAREKATIEKFIRYGKGNDVLPFYFMGWVICTANTAADWLSDILNNVHVGEGDFSQAENIIHTGALVIGTYDNFTCGNPSEFLKNINNHIPTAQENKLIFIEKTGHTYQQKEQEIADIILATVQEWRRG